MQNAHVVDEAKIQAEHKPDTLLGICEAIGTDLGFNPNYLRVALLPLLFLNPEAMIGTYVGLGVVVLASRLLFPKPKAKLAKRDAQVARDLREPELIAA